MGESLVQRLQLEGGDVVWWRDGASAAARMELEKPELVICDIRLPDMSGEDVLLRSLTFEHCCVSDGGDHRRRWQLSSERYTRLLLALFGTENRRRNQRPLPSQRSDGASAGIEPETDDRRRAMEAFAACDVAALRDMVDRLPLEAGAHVLREPAAGLIMLRGRVGGGGSPFNLGEASVARASVRLATGEVGHAMILGRDSEHARLAAILDAGWQREEWREAIETDLVAPILEARAEADRISSEETEATRVDFFTMVRGDDW